MISRAMVLLVALLQEAAVLQELLELPAHLLHLELQLHQAAAALLMPPEVHLVPRLRQAMERLVDQALGLLELLAHLALQHHPVVTQHLERLLDRAMGHLEVPPQNQAVVKKDLQALLVRQRHQVATAHLEHLERLVLLELLELQHPLAAMVLLVRLLERARAHLAVPPQNRTVVKRDLQALLVQQRHQVATAHLARLVLLEARLVPRPLQAMELPVDQARLHLVHQELLPPPAAMVHLGLLVPLVPRPLQAMELQVAPVLQVHLGLQLHQAATVLLALLQQVRVMVLPVPVLHNQTVALQELQEERLVPRLHLEAVAALVPLQKHLVPALHPAMVPRLDPLNRQMVDLLGHPMKEALRKHLEHLAPVRRHQTFLMTTH